MRLLITTQTVDLDHPALGFFHRWIEEFAAHTEQVLVICLAEGRHQLPANVRVLSLGKDVKRSRLAYVWRFYHYIYAYRHQYDAVFVHMNPEYVVLGGLFWRQWRKRVVLWYVHKSITFRLRLAARLANAVCTASTQSIRLRDPNVRAMGHGIDTELFAPVPHESSDVLRVLTVGRIARSKGLIETLRALDVLHERGIACTWTIAGAPGTAEEARYAEMLQAEIKRRPFVARIELLGAIRHDALPKLFARADVLVNISSTGGFDKAVLESLASGVPAISSSEPFRSLLAPHGLFIERPEPSVIVEKIMQGAKADAKPLREEVLTHHALSSLVPRILELLG